MLTSATSASRCFRGSGYRLNSWTETSMPTRRIFESGRTWAEAMHQIFFRQISKRGDDGTLARVQSPTHDYTAVNSDYFISDHVFGLLIWLLQFTPVSGVRAQIQVVATPPMSTGALRGSRTDNLIPPRRSAPYPPSALQRVPCGARARHAPARS